MPCYLIVIKEYKESQLSQLTDILMDIDPNMTRLITNRVYSITTHIDNCWKIKTKLLPALDENISLDIFLYREHSKHPE